MILYHFTSGDALPSILLHGLLPRQGSVDINQGALTTWDHMFDLSAVWLTTEASASINTVGNIDRMQVRIAVNLAPDSPFLMSWRSWIRRGTPELRKHAREARRKFPEVNTRRWYIYFGTVTPDQIVAAEHAARTPISIGLDRDVDPFDPKVIGLKSTLERLAIPLTLAAELKTRRS